MTEQKKKISFDPTPRPASATAEKAAPQEAGAASAPLFNRQVWERPLTAPTVTPAIRKVRVVPQPRTPQDAAAEQAILDDIAQPAAKTPKAPEFAATGLMSAARPDPNDRRPLAIAIGGGAVAAIILGMTAAFWVVEQRQDRQMISALRAEETTRTALADLTDTGAAERQAVPAGMRAPERPMNQAQTVANAIETLDRSRLHMLRQSVLAGQFSVEVLEVDGVARARLRTVNVDQAKGAVGDVLARAAAEGLIDIAPALRTPEGTLDHETMVFSLVQTSLLRDHDPASTAAAREMSRKIFAASPLRTQFNGGVRSYTVQQGDSLAYIALQLFGMPSAYTRILSANADTLQSPDQIRIGQRLIIPS